MNERIVSGGGWHVEQQLIRRKSLWLTALCIFWCMFWPVAYWMGFFETGWKSISEQALAGWLGASIAIGMVTHPLLIMLTTILWFTEAPRVTSVRSPNPDHDLHKLY